MTLGRFFQLCKDFTRFWTSPAVDLRQSTEEMFYLFIAHTKIRYSKSFMTWTCRMDMNTLHGHEHEHVSCPCPCCMSNSMLQVHGHAVSTCTGCMSLSVLHITVHAACPSSCSRSMSVIHVLVHCMVKIIEEFYPRTCSGLELWLDECFWGKISWHSPFN